MGRAEAKKNKISKWNGYDQEASRWKLDNWIKITALTQQHFGKIRSMSRKNLLSLSVLQQTWRSLRLKTFLWNYGVVKRLSWFLLHEVPSDAQRLALKLLPQHTTAEELKMCNINSEVIRTSSLSGKDLHVSARHCWTRSCIHSIGFVVWVLSWSAYSPNLLPFLNI